MITLTPLDKAVLQNGCSSQLSSLQTAHSLVADPRTLDVLLMGILAAATPAEVWEEALDRAAKIYRDYRPNER